MLSKGENSYLQRHESGGTHLASEVRPKEKKKSK